MNRQRRCFLRACGVVAALTVTALALPRATSAQTWRTFDAARQLRDSQPLSVRLIYGAGRARVQPASGRALFDVHLRYDAEGVEPLYRYSASAGTLETGVQQVSGGRSGRTFEGSEFHVSLSRHVPLRLELDVGAAEGDFDLSGLQLERFVLQTGATDTRVRFGAPNPLRLRTAQVRVGAASVRMTGLANANVEALDVNLGVGHAVLDFSGEWRGDTRLQVSSAIGQITIRVPDDVGVRVHSAGFLHSVRAPAFHKRERGVWESLNWQTARFKLHVESNGAIGRIDVQRIAR